MPTEYSKYFLNTYRRKMLKITSNKGMYLYTEEAKYLDMLSGLGVNALGGLDDEVVNEIFEQSKRYFHLSNFFETEPAGKLAEYLVKNSFAEKVFFTNSGTESIEAGLKIIKKYGNLNNKMNIVVFKNGFHGRSLGSLSITAQKKYKDQVNPLLPNIITLDFNDITGIEKAIDDNCAGVVLEVIQGEGGINIADQDFIKRLREITAKHNSLLLIDEIQTGVGRTGKLFAFEHYDIEPDLATVSKALGGGMPLGALLVNEKLKDIFSPGDHGSTFGGNPLSCAAGLKVLEKVNNTDFYSSLIKNSDYFKTKLETLKIKYPEIIGNIKIIGLMIGIEILSEEPMSIVDKFQEKNVIVNVTHGNILRLLPPLIISKDDIDQFMVIFEKILN